MQASLKLSGHSCKPVPEQSYKVINLAICDHLCFVHKILHGMPFLFADADDHFRLSMSLGNPSLILICTYWYGPLMLVRSADLADLYASMVCLF